MSQSRSSSSVKKTPKILPQSAELSALEQRIILLQKENASLRQENSSYVNQLAVVQEQAKIEEFLFLNKVKEMKTLQEENNSLNKLASEISLLSDVSLKKLTSEIDNLKCQNVILAIENKQSKSTITELSASVAGLKNKVSSQAQVIQLQKNHIFKLTKDSEKEKSNKTKDPTLEKGAKSIKRTAKRKRNQKEKPTPGTHETVFNLTNFNEDEKEYPILKGSKASKVPRHEENKSESVSLGQSSIFQGMTIIPQDSDETLDLSPRLGYGRFFDNQNTIPPFLPENFAAPLPEMDADLMSFNVHGDPNAMLSTETDPFRFS